VRRWQFVFKKPTAVGDGAVTLKGSDSIGAERIFLKISTPHSLTMTYPMNQILAGSISLENTFKWQL
jgi:hypothetical protein